MHQIPKTWMFLVSSCSWLCPIHWSQPLSLEWSCGWSSADRRCSNFIWVINNFIEVHIILHLYMCIAPYIRDLIVHSNFVKKLQHIKTFCKWKQFPQTSLHCFIFLKGKAVTAAKPMISYHEVQDHITNMDLSEFKVSAVLCLYDIDGLKCKRDITPVCLQLNYMSFALSPRYGQYSPKYLQ